LNTCRIDHQTLVRWDANHIVSKDGYDFIVENKRRQATWVLVSDRIKCLDSVIRESETD